MIDYRVRINETFTKDDVDQVKLEDHAQSDYVKFLEGEMKKPISERRDPDIILKNTRDGLVAEHWLTEHKGYINFDEKYMDVLHPDGFHVEIKTVSTYGGVSAMNQRIRDTFTKLWRRRVQWRQNIADHVMLFTRHYDEYTCHGFYQWSDEKNNWECVNKMWYNEFGGKEHA